MATTTLVRPIGPGAPPANRLRRRLVLCSVITILVGSNVVSNRVWPEGYIPWNLAVAGVLLLLARHAGLSWADIGLGRARLRRGLLLGALVAGLVAAVYLAALAFPTTREAFLDRRAAGPLAAALFAALVRIPLGTVVLEEVAFRGVLPALVNGGDKGGFWRGALVSSALFGLWHVLPSLGMSTSNAAVGAAVGGWGLAGQAALAVLATAAAGLLMMLWRRWSGHLATPALCHLATNSLGVLIAWWVVSTAG
jgi:membrane protease YdiL (CAAX protease family)